MNDWSDSDRSGVCISSRNQGVHSQNADQVMTKAVWANGFVITEKPRHFK